MFVVNQVTSLFAFVVPDVKARRSDGGGRHCNAWLLEVGQLLIASARVFQARTEHVPQLPQTLGLAQSSGIVRRPVRLRISMLHV